MNCCNVSVVIPTFNRIEFLERAILSVVNQSLPCREILVIDDGSTDNTQKLVMQLQQRQTVQIRYHYQENSGPAAARNIGIMRACCETIAFLDSDDHWHKNKLQLQYQQLKANDGFLISHTKEKWLRRGRHLNQKQIHIPRHGNIFEHCLHLCAVGMSTVMVRKKLFSSAGYFDETLPCCEDYDMWLRVSRNHHFLLIDAPLTVKEGGGTIRYQFNTGPAWTDSGYVP